MCRKEALLVNMEMEIYIEWNLLLHKYDLGDIIGPPSITRGS